MGFPSPRKVKGPSTLDRILVFRNDKSSKVRFEIAKLLFRNPFKHKKYAKVAERMLYDTTLSVKINAMKVIREMPSYAFSALPKLKALRIGKDWVLCHQARLTVKAIQKAQRKQKKSRD